MYSIADYGLMIADKIRMAAFSAALRRAITPDSVVIDIGTGTGIFALLACRFGARRVYAIEPSDVIHIAREIAAANGFARQIEFIQAVSTEIDLPERGDVIVADIGGCLPWYEQHIPAIADARCRFLAPGGMLIPQQDAAWAAVIEAPDLYARQVGLWTEHGFEMDMEAARCMAVNTFSTGRITAGQLLTAIQRWMTIDYRVVDNADAHGRLVWTATRAGTAHGVAAGFDRTVADGVCLSNAPDAADDIRPERIYGTIFFPWSRPVGLEPGDRIEVVVEARLVAGDYIWSWKTNVFREGSTESKAEFVQSTFLGTPLSPAQLRKRAASHLPRLNESGRMALLVLNAMQDGRPLGDIASQLAAGFDQRFRRPQDALSFVADLSQQFG